MNNSNNVKLPTFEEVVSRTGLSAAPKPQSSSPGLRSHSTPSNKSSVHVLPLSHPQRSVSYAQNSAYQNSIITNRTTSPIVPIYTPNEPPTAPPPPPPLPQQRQQIYTNRQTLHPNNYYQITPNAAAYITPLPTGPPLYHHQQQRYPQVSSRVETPFHGSFQPYTQLTVPAKPKRVRRKAHEMIRLYLCNYPNCKNSYGTLNHLNAHIQIKRHGPKRRPEEFKEIRDLLREHGDIDKDALERLVDKQRIINRHNNKGEGEGEGSTTNANASDGNTLEEKNN